MWDGLIEAQDRRQDPGLRDLVPWEGRHRCEDHLGDKMGRTELRRAGQVGARWVLRGDQ